MKGKYHPQPSIGLVKSRGEDNGCGEDTTSHPSALCGMTILLTEAAQANIHAALNRALVHIARWAPSHQLYNSSLKVVLTVLTIMLCLPSSRTLTSDPHFFLRINYLPLGILRFSSVFSALHYFLWSSNSGFASTEIFNLAFYTTSN